MKAPKTIKTYTEEEKKEFEIQKEKDKIASDAQFSNTISRAIELQKSAGLR